MVGLPLLLRFSYGVFVCVIHELSVGAEHGVLVVHEGLCVDLTSSLLHLDLLVRIYCAHEFVVAPIVHLIPNLRAASHYVLEVFRILQELLHAIGDCTGGDNSDDEHAEVEHVFALVQGEDRPERVKDVV